MHDLTFVASVFLDNIVGEAKTSPYISDTDLLQISRRPGTTFNITFITQNTRHVSLSQFGRLGDLSNWFCSQE